MRIHERMSKDVAYSRLRLCVSDGAMSPCRPFDSAATMTLYPWSPVALKISLQLLAYLAVAYGSVR
jgi:hypothetical protein